MPHERIAQAARSRKADMVVIGTHGRTGLAKLFVGSVRSRVLAVAPCPVLTGERSSVEAALSASPMRRRVLVVDDEIDFLAA